jgi:cell division protein FtsB
MNRSRRKNFNAIDAPSLARWIVLTLFIALTGLIYVYLSIQLHRLGDQQNKLEKQLASLRNQNEVATGQIAALTSRAALQRRLKEGYIKMIPIAEQNIVRLSAPARSPEEDAIQPVANEEMRP